MEFTVILWTMGGIVVGSLIGSWIARHYRKFNGPMVVTCPETKKAVGIKLNAPRAAVADLIGIEDLEMTNCTRWPERQDCGRDCLSQVEGSPEGCLVVSRLSEWYEGKSCVVCDRPFSNVDWNANKPGLLAPDGSTVGWEEVDPATLPDVLATHLPVCSPCHVTARFRQKYPEMVIDLN